MRRSLLRASDIGRFSLPQLTGEPFLHYAPGSAERTRLVSALKRLRDQEAVEIPCIVGGKEYYTGDVGQHVMPTDHTHVLANFHQADSKLVGEAIEAAAKAKEDWANAPFAERAMVFKKAGDLIAGKYRAEMNAAVMLGTGKNVWQAEIDASVEAIDFLRQNTNYAQYIYEQQPPLNSPNTWNRLEYRPLEGFVAAITPFNFCAIGANLPAAPALMGNTVLWKPSPTAVYGNYLVMRILEEAGLPDGVINFLPSSAESFGGTAIPHPDFGGLHFTGSTGVFNHLWKQIGDNLPNYKSYPRVVGETGGKNFHLVHSSADLTSAVNSTVRGAFEFQGQKCSATSRLYVPQGMWPEFKSGMVDIMSQIKMGQPDELDSFMTAVIDEKSFDKIKSYIDAAKESSDCEVIGGNCDKSRGYFIEPTVIVTKDPFYVTMKDELFGPVLTVYVYEDGEQGFEDVMKVLDNTTPYGLTGSIWAKDRHVINKATNALRNSAGNFYVNDKSTGAVVGEQPFGGGRMSGTNDKAGSFLNLLRWVSPRTIKEYTAPITDWKYPHMES